LNAKAAVFAIEALFEERGRRLPVIVSGTITDQSGRTLTGQTPEAFWNSLRHAQPIAVGLNCALGAKLMRPYIEELSKVADTFISCYPMPACPIRSRRPATTKRRNTPRGCSVNSAKAAF